MTAERYWILRYRRQDNQWGSYIGERVFATRNEAVELADRLTRESVLAPLDSMELLIVEIIERVEL